MGESHYRVKGWERFQHYNKPRPAWIKLHRTLLDDHEFQSLSTRSRALLVMLWLIAAESENGTIPDEKAIAWRLRLPLREIVSDVKTLGHFIEPVYTEPRAALASDREETETETETETEPARAPAKSPNKIAFAPRVYLTEKEHAGLTEKHGPEAVAWMVEKLDAWKDGKGLNGKGRGSDAGKIRSWVVEAWEQHQAKTGNGAGKAKEQESPPSPKPREYQKGETFDMRGRRYLNGVLCPAEQASDT